MNLIDNQRHLFDIPDEVAYLNCAYMGPAAKAVHLATLAGAQKKRHPWTVTGDDFYSPAAHLKSLAAPLFDCSADDIALTPSVSYGAALAARNLRLKAGRNILVIEGQFPSNIYAWQQLAGEQMMRMTTVRRPLDGRWTEAILAQLDERIAMAALPQVHWADGGLIDLEPISDRCAELGIPLVLDLTQSLGVMSFSVQRIRPAFVFSAAYKWLLGPYGLSYTYVSPEYQDGQPIEYNWINRRDSENFAGLVDYTDQFQPGARRYDSGQHSSTVTLSAAIAALSMIQEWGVDQIAATLAEKTRQIREMAHSIGYQSVPEALSGPHILGLTGGPEDRAALSRKLAAENVWLSVRGSTLRISPHLYNTGKDAERLISVLSSVT